MPLKKIISTKSPKSPKKKSASVKQKKQPLLVVDGDKAFWVNNGPILASLKELEVALSGMSEEQFHHHVGRDKNDFANWIEEVLEDMACAKDIQLAHTIDKTIAVVQKHIKKYV